MLTSRDDPSRTQFVKLPYILLENDGDFATL